jgi:N-acetylneuraminate synthase/N,N'-diacetyllegionaminate synthase
MGDGLKKIHAREREAVRKMGKMMVYSRDLEEGHEFTHGDFSLKSPRDGISPQEIDIIIGKKLIKNVTKNVTVKKSDFGISGDEI